MPNNKIRYFNNIPIEIENEAIEKIFDNNLKNQSEFKKIIKNIEEHNNKILLEINKLELEQKTENNEEHNKKNSDLYHELEIGTGQIRKKYEEYNNKLRQNNDKLREQIAELKKSKNLS